MLFFNPVTREVVQKYNKNSSHFSCNNQRASSVLSCSTCQPSITMKAEDTKTLSRITMSCYIIWQCFLFSVKDVLNQISVSHINDVVEEDPESMSCLLLKLPPAICISGGDVNAHTSPTSGAALEVCLVTYAISAQLQKASQSDSSSLAHKVTMMDGEAGPPSPPV